MAEQRRFCARCKAEIPAERIEVMPETRVCVKCAEALGGTEFEVQVVAIRGSKKEGIKKNYIEYETRKRRKLITPIEE
jgi:hypothetical protein